MDNYITLGDALAKVGEDSVYQWKLFMMISFQQFASALLLLSPTYIFITPPLTCGIMQQSCSDNSSTCQGLITFNSSYDHITLVNEFNLICDQKYLITVAQSSMFFGSIIGCLLFSYFGVIILKIQDSYGRKKMLIISWAITTLGIVGMVFTINMIWFITFNIVAGFGVNGTFNISFVILTESAGEAFRQKSCIGVMIVFGVTEVLAAVFYYSIENWRVVWLIFPTTTSIVGLFLTYFLVETPKYLLTQGKTVEAYLSLNYIAKSNSKPSLNDSLVLVEELPSEFKLKTTDGNIDNNTLSQTKGLEEGNAVEVSFNALFNTKPIRLTTLGFMAMLFSLQLIYYGGQFSLVSISSGSAVYLLGACIGCAELSTYIFTHFFIETLKRKSTILISFIVCISFMLCYLAFGLKSNSIDLSSTCDFCQKEIFLIVLSCIVRISVSIGFGIQPLYANEAYPTLIRTTGTGFVFTFGLIGSFISPYIFILADYTNLNPYLIIVLLSMIGPLGTLLLKETLGAKLADNIVENDE